MASRKLASSTAWFRAWAAMSLLLTLVLGPLAARASDPVVLTGSGSTFVYPIMSRWIGAAARRTPRLDVLYEPLGSGRGVMDISKHAVDFGATDGALTDGELAGAPGLLHVPVALGAVVVVYNVPGASGLRLSSEVLAQIFLGRIRRWDDQRITRDNPELTLPQIAIYVAHRADGSGTTAIFTDYLSKVSPDWKSGPGSGRAIHWPVGTGSRGNEGVAGLVSRGDGWIGYVELTYALQGRLGIARLRNRDGQFVSPSVATISAAVAGKQVPDDFRTSFTDAPGAAAWPMSGFTWALVYQEHRDALRARALVDFLWLCTHEGQDMAVDLGFAPLPPDLVVRIERALKTIRVDGSPVLGAR